MLIIGRLFAAIGALFRGVMNAFRALIPGGRRTTTHTRTRY